MMAATKCLEDVPCGNQRWAKIGGLTLQELNALEVEFLSAIAFCLAVHPEDYARGADEKRFHGLRGGDRHRKGDRAEAGPLPDAGR